MIFVALPGLEILDFAGPMQAFSSANESELRYSLTTVSTQPSIQTSQGVTFANLQPLPDIRGDELIVIPGMPYALTRRFDRAVLRWLVRSYRAGATVASVCTGSFVIGEAGLLDGKRCTTHWTRISELRRRFPTADVIDDELFVADGRVITSAGIASGIDMALSLIEDAHGPRVAAEVAREMVVYLRREGSHEQSSVYLDYRKHIHQGVHRVQDWLLQHPDKRATISDLSDVAMMSARNLTRVFRKATGVSIKEYATRVRLERARTLLSEPGLSLEAVARRSGFGGARQLRRIWSARYGATPSRN